MGEKKKVRVFSREFKLGAVERMDLSRFEVVYSDDGRPAYPPELMLQVWLYAYAGIRARDRHPRERRP